MSVKLIPLSLMLFTILSLLGHSVLFNNTPLVAQTGNLSNIHSEKLGVKITNPMTNSNVPVGTLLVNGTSTDTSLTDCGVYIDWNDLKPMQNVTAIGPGGKNDFSKWSFEYTRAYHLIVGGANELTSKITCHSDSPGNITTKFYSINVTGINTKTSNTMTTSSSFLKSNETNNNTDGYRSVTFHDILPQYNEREGTANDKSNNNKEDDSVTGGDANANYDASSKSLDSNNTNTLSAKEGRDSKVLDDNIESTTTNLNEHLASNISGMHNTDTSTVNEDNNDTDVNSMRHYPDSQVNKNGVHISQIRSLESNDNSKLQSSDEVLHDKGTMEGKTQGSNVELSTKLMTELGNTLAMTLPQDKGKNTDSDSKENSLKSISDKNDLNKTNKDMKVDSKKDIDKDKDLKPIKAKKIKKKTPAPEFDNIDPFRLT